LCGKINPDKGATESQPPIGEVNGPEEIPLPERVTVKVVIP
tara:strand:- start:486 stop:608 length:123 start_codon:yes stop_codon:yes gene_type:complete